MAQITSDRPADQIASRLLGFDTATLYESAEQPGFMIPDIRPVELGYRVAGPALTVACPGGDNLMLHAAVADARPGEVLVVQCHDLTYGVWGEVLMTAATARGIRALIIEGGVRDIDALRAAKFPVFCRAVAMRGAAKKRRGLVRQPISCGGVLVWPGDLVVADDSGVLVLPAGEVERVIERARQRQREEEAMMKELRNNQTTVNLLDLGSVLTAVGHVGGCEGRAPRAPDRGRR